ncbi:MAG: translation initiation factor IF-2 [Desulfobacterales bacterium]|nr:translation initiation factor IF-2 [Desulfobacterales bacterium]
MAKIRVYELAKDLSMTNKALLNKIKEAKIKVGSHMSSLDDDVVHKIKNHIFGKKEDVVEEKRVKSTIIRRRKKVAEQEVSELPEVEEKPDESEESQKEPVEAKEKEPDVAEKEAKSEQEEKPAKKKVAKKKAAEKKAPKKKVEDDTSEKEIAEEKTEDKTEAKKTEDVKAEDEKAEKKVAGKKVTEKKTAEKKPAEKKVADKKASKKKTAKEESKKQSKKKKKAKKFQAAKIIKLPDLELEAKKAQAKKEEKKEQKKEAPNRKRVFKKKQVKKVSEEKPKSVTEVPETTEKKGKKFKKKDKKTTEEENGEKKFLKKPFKKRSVVEGNALYDSGPRRKGKRGKQKPKTGQKTQITTPKAIKRRVKIDDTIVLAELAKRMGIKANEMIVKLMGLGVMATVNQTIDFDTAVLVASEFEFELERAAFEEDNLITVVEDNPEQLKERPPVVTIMGHVDHGKTSLLDTIRKSGVADGEAGGITQHIGAYNVHTDKGQIVFLDTPGHEAFTAMRSRGAQVTDIVVLVVAADDGVMPQTIEAINHSKAAGVPIIVAVNKMDKEDADPDRVKRELSDHGILSEDWGGDAIFINVSAKTGLGIDELLEMILLQAEVQELRANPDKLASGFVVESKLDSGRGPIATVLVKDGTLKTGQSVVCGVYFGRIRVLNDDRGNQIDSAGPSIPAEIIGLSGVPEAGDQLISLSTEKSAKQISSNRIKKQRSFELAKSSRVSLENLFETLSEGDIKDLNLIIRADVHGSIEALKESLQKLTNEEIKINIIHSATGTVTETDVSLAAVSNAIILGFNVRPGSKVHDLVKEENVDMRFYDVIYDAIKDIKNAILGLMESTFNEVVVGRAEVREVFVIPKRGSIAGSFITDGKIERGLNVRLLRDGIIKFDGKLGSLRRFKDDVKEVNHGYECGIGIENYNDIKSEDIIECYRMDEVKPTLD